MNGLETQICRAINELRIIRFWYEDQEKDILGFRIVEPHTLGYYRSGKPALSAWFLQGETSPGEGEGWRDYLLERISSLSVLDQRFAGPRSGYVALGGKKFRTVECDLSLRRG